MEVPPVIPRILPALALVLGLALSSSSRSAAAAPSVDVGGYVQARETLRGGDGSLTASLNRARLSADARLDSTFTARVQAEFAGGASGGGTAVQLRDAYVRAERGAWSAQAGQFKTPMSREHLLSISALETPDRALVVDSLATRRDVGVQLAFSPRPSFDVALGLFNGEGQNVAVNRDSNLLLVGRLAMRPIEGLAFGLSGATYAGDSTRAGAEVEIAAQGAWVRSELIAQEVDGRDRRDEGWYVLAGYRVLPSWSVVARREALHRPALDASRSRHRSTTLGLLWEPPGGRVRGWLDWVEREAGQEPAITHAWIAQLQAKF
jgi:hypothetical protein